MCGIAGFVGKKQPGLLSKMLTSIEHRGPDGEGKFEQDSFAIGMRRLAIIDPNGGWQPIWNEDRTIAIVFNGEIYNYQEIWQELQQHGHKFATDHSDTETIVHGYEQWGTQVIDKLQGMFAFAILDLRKKQVLLARDRLGIKPLYYFHDNGCFYFASEIKALLQSGELSPALNKDVLYEYLSFRTHDHREQTFYNNVKRLLPGSYLLLDAQGNIQKQVKYWQPAINTQFYGNKTDNEYATELRELFIKTVQSHMISDVPVGVNLSGGLDSTGVVCVMNKLIEERKSQTHTKNLLGFSAVYPNDPIDESKYMDIVINATGIKQYTVTPDPDNFWQEVDSWLHTQEEPTISSAPYAIYNVARLAHNHVKVLLSGQGGDELFAGYIPHFASYISTARAQGKYLELLREIIKGRDMYNQYLLQILKGKLRQKPLGMSSMLNEDFFPNREFKYVLEKNLNQRLFKDISEFSLTNVLRYEDKNTMAFSIEARVPFLDHKFVEYVLSLPVDQKIKHGWNRYIYRNAMKGLIPEEIRLRRKKIGFTTPEVRWLKGKRRHIQEIFGSAEFKDLGIFSEHTASRFAAWCDSKIAADGLMFWRILNTYLWIKHFKINT